MRLLRVQNGDFSLVERVGNNIPPYAILSHTWGEDEDEVTVNDILVGTGREKAGFPKIQFCGAQATKDGLEYFWVDTCCIDKSSSAELQEAINSMFQWYHRAIKCYVYLSDVSSNGSDHANTQQSFRDSRWFTRGWTLQELVAPACVEFFTSEGTKMGDKESMVHDLHDITGISIKALQGSPLSGFSIDERISWAENRHTKREEDAAYSLLGIFDIHMPLLYGEGRKKAFARLERKIMKSSEDETWPTSSSGVALKHIDRELGMSSSWFGASTDDITEQLDLSDILIGTGDLQLSQSQDIANTGPYHAPNEIEGIGPELQEIDDIAGSLDGLIKELNEFQPDGHDLGPVLSVLSKARQPVNMGNRTKSKLYTGFKDHSDVSDNIIESTSTNMKEKSKTPVPKMSKEEPSGGLKRAGTFSQHVGQQLEVYQHPNSKPSNVVTTKSSSRSSQQLTEIEVYLKNRDVQERLGYAGLEAIMHFLRDMNLRARLEAQTVVNDWLEVTKYNERYSVPEHLDKQVSSRLEGTCEWIWAHPTYLAWLSDDRPADATKVLWLHAPAGYGKTVLFANLIENIRDQQLYPLAYFFASPHAQAGGDPNFIIRSWISQIAQLDPHVLGLVRKNCEIGGRASEQTVWALFETIVSEHRSYAFFIDGFDEYSREEDTRTEFLQKLKKATSRGLSRILISSRDETDIRAELATEVDQADHHILYDFKVTEEEVRGDISLFSRSVVDKKLPNKDDRLRQDLASKLAAKCEGMFLWIRLQQNQLRGGKNAKQLQNIVENMPVGLEKTYERNWKIIQDLPEEDQSRALAILKWTTFAFRPLTVAEITEALIVELDSDGNTIHWDELPDEIDDEYIKSEIIDICGALVEVRNGSEEANAGNRTIHLIHQSVREFLLSNFQQAASIKSRRSIESAQNKHTAEHEYLASVCLTYICCDEAWHQQTSHATDGRGAFILYASRHWSSHMNSAKPNGVELNRLAIGLFHPKNENFERWSKLLETEEPSTSELGEPYLGIASPLYHATLLNYPSIMEHIWAGDEAQLDAIGGEYGTPLQAACYKGHVSAFDLLIRWGANINQEAGKYGVPINAAIVGGHDKLAEILIRMDMDHTLRDPLGRTPLYTAAKQGNATICSLLIEAGSDLNAQNSHGWTALNVASDEGYFDIVKLLLEKGADMNIPNSEQWTPLLSAADSGHFEIVQHLIEQGADLTAKTTDGWTVLNAAADSGHIKVVKYVLEHGAEIAAATKLGWTALSAAADSGHLEVVEYLLKQGADISPVTQEKWTALNSAANNGHVDIVKALLENDADMTITNEEGWTPLNSAAGSGHLEVVKTLLDKGADMSVANSLGWTPLNSASHYGHIDIVKLLLAKGADMTIADNDEWTPLHSAANNGHLEVVKALLENGADVRRGNRFGWTPLNSVSYSGHLEIAKTLLDSGADLSPTHNGWTPLHSASDKDHIEIVNLLLEKGADVSLVASSWTPLSAAADNGNLEIVKLLLEKGASFTCNPGEVTPLGAASGNGHVDIVKYLLEKGADVTATFREWTPLAAATHSGHDEITRYLFEKEPDVNRFDVLHGSMLHLLAYKGLTDLLRTSYEKRSGDPHLLDRHGQSVLHLAARGGHVDTFKYLLGLGIDPKQKDLAGNGLLEYACSGGSLEVFDAVLDLGLEYSPRKGHWTLLHWACRTGSHEVADRLIKKGYRSQAVTDPLLKGEWDPISIAKYFGNEKMLAELSQSSQFLLEASSFAVREYGKKIESGNWCNGCLHVGKSENWKTRADIRQDIYGPYFRCQSCEHYDYCFMCRPIFDKAHSDDDCELLECPIPDA